MARRISFKPSTLSSCQEEAVLSLKGRENIFLTGPAGSGKSFLIRQFLKDQESKYFPVLASTGAAAILLGGRTFHSFFGLGILEGGVQATVERAVGNKRLVKRLKNIEGILVDEVSMLSGRIWTAAEKIARRARENTKPWGGIRVIAVGDFAQLPPVNPYGQEKEWAFLDPAWEASEFKSVVLNQIMRSQDPDFLIALASMRDGISNDSVKKLLTERSLSPPADFDGTRLFARREDVEKYNLVQLEKIDAKIHTFETLYSGKETEVERFKKNAPIPEVISLKEGALVMLRQNDPELRWVNGSLGHIRKIQDHQLSIELANGLEIQIEPNDFTLLDADGQPVVTAKNFPLTLAWGVTIHKAQGTTLEKAQVDLRRLWEPGQAYVAVSRVRSPDGLFIEGWSQNSIKADPAVVEFHRRLLNPPVTESEAAAAPSCVRESTLPPAP